MWSAPGAYQCRDLPQIRVRPLALGDSLDPTLLNSEFADKALEFRVRGVAICEALAGYCAGLILIYGSSKFVTGLQVKRVLLHPENLF